MLKIKRAMLNSVPAAGAANASCAWVEIDNFGGETPLESWRLRVQPQVGELKDLWKGGELDVLAGSVPLRLTDGTAAANNIPPGEPRQIIEVPGLSLRPALGGKLVLFNGGSEVDSVSLPMDTPAGVRLYRVGETMTAPDTRPYHP
jgi:hypothetical protein